MKIEIYFALLKLINKTHLNQKQSILNIKVFNYSMLYWLLFGVISYIH